MLTIMHVRHPHTWVAAIATPIFLFSTLQSPAPSESQPGEVASEAAIAGMAAAGAGVVDDDVLSDAGTAIIDETDSLTITGTGLTTPDLSLSLPTDTPLELTAGGVAASIDSDTGLAVVVAPVEGGSARLLTVAGESYSDDPTHTYDYPIDLQPGVELRQLTTGEVVLVGAVREPASQQPFELTADTDPAVYALGLEEAAAGVGLPDYAVGTDEVVVGAFMAPWSVDAEGTSLPTRYEVDGNTLVQVVDTEGAVFPVVSDPAPLIVIGLLAAARVFVAASARAFATTTIRTGLAYTTRGGFTTFARFKAWAGAAQPGHQWHHIVGQANTRFSSMAIHNPRNLIQIPTAIHQRCVNSWMSRNAALIVGGEVFRVGSTVRTQVQAWTWQRQYDFGVRLLRHCGVNVG